MTPAAFVRRPYRWIKEMSRKEGETGECYSVAPNFAFEHAAAEDAADLLGDRVGRRAFHQAKSESGTTTTTPRMSQSVSGLHKAR